MATTDPHANRRPVTTVDAPTVFELNASTAIAGFAANDDRLNVFVGNPTNFDIIVRPLAAGTTPGLEVGWLIVSGWSGYIFPPGEPYTGVLSVLAITDSPDIFMVEI